MQVIEQRQLISRKNLVGCNDIIFFEHYVLKLMGLNGTIPILGGGVPPFSFLGEHYKRAKINNKKEKYLDNQWKILLQ